jgi:DNA-directed RNA polymerase specialized sigma24 family protein
MPVTGTWLPRVPRVLRGRRPGRRSRDDDDARSSGQHQAAGTSAGPGPDATAVLGEGDRDDSGGRAADPALAVFCHGHYRTLVLVAALLTGSVAAGEAIVQDAFVSVDRAWWRLRDDDEALGFVRRAVVTGARSRRADPPEPPGPLTRADGAGRHPVLAKTALMAAVSALPARQREALVLRYYADWPDRQIAAAMGITRHALDRHVQRGMRALQARTAPGRGSDT